MTDNRRQYEELSRLKKEMKDLKSIVTDKFSAQININSELQAQLETMKLRMAKFSGMNGKLNSLLDKYKEQRGQVNLLVQLLRGKWEKAVCECGRNVTTLSVKQKLSPKQDKFNPGQEKTEHHILIDKECQTEDEKPLFTYSDNLKNIIEKPLPEVPLAESLSLSSDGVCQFVISEHDADGRIVQNVLSGHRNYKFYSKFIILPDQFRGLIICVELNRLSPQNCELNLAAPSGLNHNKRVSLPVKLKLQLEMKLNNGELYLSNYHEFNIHKLGSRIYPQYGKCLIPLLSVSRETFNDGLKLKFSAC